ncbi:MAG: putative oxidoreductase C-terminal domain-containing protein [Bacteroidales bacterium]
MDKNQFSGEPGEVKLITLAPGHFHAYLVQKDMYRQVNPTVYVYAPEGPEVEQYLDMIENYNTRSEDPTSWNQVVYTGSDYLEKMLEEKKGNVVVLAGNNRNKTNYIKKAVDVGLNVFSDKPMAINADNFDLLIKAFESAENNNVLLYDIMTERYEITNILQKEIMSLPGVFGQLRRGSVQDPAVIKESVHHFFKYVSGQVLRRPPWFFDVTQQGEGLVDVTTHLVDLIQWACFPEQIIDYKTDVEMISANRWPTPLTVSRFENITGEPDFPSYLNDFVINDTMLHVYANGEMNFKLNDIHARVIVKWDYRAPEGAGDTHYSFTGGSNASLIIKQGTEQNYKPVLYIEPADPSGINDFENVLLREFKVIEERYPGVELNKLDGIWEVVIPDLYDVGHEAHFAQVMEKYLQFLTGGKLPDWEIPNMISKYFITTKALELAR